MENWDGPATSFGIEIALSRLQEMTMKMGFPMVTKIPRKSHGNKNWLRN